MKKATLCVAILMVLSFASIAWAETVGDIDDDGFVGLPEAIYALQVTSGIKGYRPYSCVNIR